MKQRPASYYYLDMHTHYLDVPYYNEKRRIRVLLPKDYAKEEWASYPVLYMHDGQNVFYSKEAFSGHSWKVIPTIKNNKDLPKIIIVGVDNAGENRLNEYAPWLTDTTKNSDYAKYGGDGMAYGDWLVNTVKPFIDHNYRTINDKNHTFLAGSSMGGIITAYIGAAYPQTFGVLGVFSLASWFSERDFIRYVAHHRLDSDTKVYIQVGTNEGDETDSNFIDNINQGYIDCSLNYYNTLINSGKKTYTMWLRILANETHHEKYWADHFLEFLKFAFKE